MSSPGGSAGWSGDSRAWLWWVVGGCGGAVLLVAIVFAVLLVVLARNATATTSCLPGDFPIKAGMARVTSVKLGNECTTVYRTQDSQGSVERYYAAALDRDGWQVLSRRRGVIQFQRRGNRRQVGEVAVQAAATGEQVTVALAGG